MNQSGFTMIEILIVVIIIGILIIAAIPQINEISRTSWTKVCSANCSTLEKVSELYVADNYTYPANQDDLSDNYYLKSNIICPADHRETYSIQADHTWLCANKGSLHN